MEDCKFCGSDKKKFYGKIYIFIHMYTLLHIHAYSSKNNSKFTHKLLHKLISLLSQIRKLKYNTTNLINENNDHGGKVGKKQITFTYLNEIIHDTNRYEAKGEPRQTIACDYNSSQETKCLG